MLKTVFLTALTLAIAVGGGGASVWLVLEGSRGVGSVTVGEWTTYPDYGTPQANPYSRARFAREGGLSLGQAEGIAFTATRDADGEPLRRGCTYQVAGNVPPARLWVIHAADEARQALPPVGQLVPALHSRALLRAADSTFTISVGPNPAPGNWLPLSGTGPLRLVVTLYDTPVSGDSGMANLTLPRIARVGCDD